MYQLGLVTSCFRGVKTAKRPFFLTGHMEQEQI